MIKLRVEEYCHNCPNFSAKVTVKEEELCTGIDMNDPPVRICDTLVTCAHAKRCEGITRYLRKATKEVG